MQTEVKGTISGQPLEMKKWAQILDPPFNGCVNLTSYNLFESSSFIYAIDFRTFFGPPYLLFATHTELLMTFHLSTRHRL